MSLSPVCAVLTPAGRGAIATIAVVGEQAVSLVSCRFRPASGRTLSSYGSGSVVFGRFAMAPDYSEELVVGLPAARQVEIHCHGGKAAVVAICEALVAEGAQLVDSGSLIRDLEPNSIRVAALLALAEARTARTAAILLNQYRGAWAEPLARLVKLFESADQANATLLLDELLSRAELGLHLTEPWKVVLAGPPNAGKSSLMNALMGFDRSIVFPEPGTTRDVLSALTAIDGWPVELCDTAGLRESAEVLEAEGVSRTRRELLSADLVLYVSDRTERWDGELFREVQELAWRAPVQRLPLVVIIHNKADLEAAVPEDRPDGLTVSAKLGMGVDRLCQQISEALVPLPPSTGAAVPFTDWQVQSLQQAAALVTAGNSRHALDTIQPLVGNPPGAA